MLTTKQIEFKLRQEKAKLANVDNKKAKAGEMNSIMKRRFEQEARTIQQHIKRLEIQLKSAKKV